MRVIPIRRAAALAALCASFALAACGSNASSASATPTPNDGRIPVVTTFSTLNSFVEGVGGNRVRVTNLVPIGASPETYQPTPQDVAQLSQARIIFENGAGLEAWLDRTLHDAAAKDALVVIGSDELPVKNLNPHLWMDPEYAQVYVEKIRDALVTVDPAHAAEYRANASAYNTKLTALEISIRKQIATIPPQKRVMIVQHNAWQYYNDRFGIKTLGIIEVNPGQEPNPQDLALLVDLANQYHVTAIFSEPEYSPKLAQALAGSAHISIVDNLYDDSIGTNPKVHDYISMLQYDTGEIVKALK